MLEGEILLDFCLVNFLGLKVAHTFDMNAIMLYER